MLHPQLVGDYRDHFSYLGSELRWNTFCQRLTKCKSLLSVILLLSSTFCFFQRHMLTRQSLKELEPLTDTYVQADEVDMGMTYDELSVRPLSFDETCS